MIRVSRLLSQYGLVDDAWWTPVGRDRGTVVHALAEGEMLRQPVTAGPAYDGYARAVRDGLAALGFVPLFVERRLTRWAEGITGRPDGIGYVPRPVGKVMAGPAIVDIKSGDKEPYHALQLALYEWLAAATEDLRAALPTALQDLPWQRVGLYVKENGRFKIHPYAEPTDREVALSLVTVTNWRITHGLLASERTDPRQPDDPAVPDAGPGAPVAG